MTQLNWQRATAAKTAPPEACLNLWWFVDDQSKLVYRLAGRVYALAGSDEEKLRLLQALALTDFHTARLFEIPKRFVTVTAQSHLEGVVDSTVIRTNHADVFDHVFKTLEKDLPTQMRSVGGEPKTYRLTIPQQPLCVTTCVVEYEDGTLVPQASPTV